MRILLVSTDENQIQKYIDDLVHKNRVNKGNVFEIHPLKEEIVISQIRDLKKELITRINGGRWIVFFEFETADLESQNALLKIVEEAVDDNFILVSNNEYKVTSTLRSRLKTVRLKSAKNISLDQSQKRTLGLLVEKPLENFNLVSKLDRLASISFLDQLLLFYRSTLIHNKQATLIIRKILTLRRLISENNLNCQLALDNLLIFIARTSMI